MAVVCLLIAACGAADERVDPGDLALRDLLGVQPKVVAGWDEAQRAAAREVLAGGLAAREAVALAAPLADDEAALVRALAASDAVLDDAGDDARGLVVVTAARRELAVIDSPTATALLVAEPADPAVSLDLDPRAWTCPEPPCDLAVLAALAVDAAPGAPLVRVRPVAQLATIAAMTAGDDGVPILLVNPVVTAVGVEAAGGAIGAGAVGATMARTAPALPPPPLTRGAWTYGATRSACATTVASDCATCLGGGLCEPVWGSVSGMEACTMLEADPGRNYDLVCINLAVSLADIRACVQGRAPSCAIDDNAIDLPAELANNANFLDDATCAAALEACLSELYGTGGGSDGCGACDGCDCGGCDDNSGNNGCNSNDQNMDNNCNGCNGGGCNDSGGGCNGGGGGCNGGGGNGSCSVAGAGRRGPGLGVALAWVLLPVPVALRARRRARRAAIALAIEPPAPT